MARVLIIGASRGIGLETLRCALTAGQHVRALARSAGAITVDHPVAPRGAASWVDCRRPRSRGDDRIEAAENLAKVDAEGRLPLRTRRARSCFPHDAMGIDENRVDDVVLAQMLLGLHDGMRCIMAVRIPSRV